MTVLIEAGDRLLLEDGFELLMEDGESSPSDAAYVLTIGVPPLKSTQRTVELQASTLESLEVEVYCSADPTGTDPEFTVTTLGIPVDDSSTYTAGVWSSSYGARTEGWAFARTPLLGSVGDIEIEPGQRLWLWIKTVAGEETAVTLTGMVVVN